MSSENEQLKASVVYSNGVELICSKCKERAPLKMLQYNKELSGREYKQYICASCRNKIKDIYRSKTYRRRHV